MLSAGNPFFFDLLDQIAKRFSLDLPDHIVNYGVQVTFAGKSFLEVTFLKKTDTGEMSADEMETDTFELITQGDD